MTEELCHVLSSLNDGSLVEQSEQYLNARIEEDRVLLISQLVEILQNPQIPINVRSSAGVILWKQYPEEISDIGEDSEEQQLPPEVTQGILQPVYALIIDPASPAEFVHHLCHIYARCASYSLHLYSDAQPLQALLQFASECEDVSLACRICDCLTILLDSYYPEEDEARQLFALLLRLFSSPDCVISAISVLSKIVEVMTDFFNSDEEECAGENAELLQQVLEALKQVSGEGAAQIDAFKCWERIGKYAPIYLAEVEQEMIPTVCEALSSDNRELIFAACSLLKRITKIEIDDESEQLQSIETNYGDIVTMLVDVMSSVESTDCVSAEDWEPCIAAYETLHVVAEIAADLMQENMKEVVVGLLQSENFGERDSGLKLLECIIRFTTTPLEMSEFIKATLQLLSDEIPCIKHDALKCIRKGLERIAEVNKEDETLVSISTLVEEFAPMLDDVAPIASEVALILSIFTEIPSYEGTLDTLNLLFEKSAAMDQYEAKDIFKAIETICREGSDEPVLAFFPALVEAYGAVFSDEENIWRSHDFGELLQVYAFRFNAQLGEFCEPLGQLLLEAAAAGSDYSSDVLLPLSSLSTMNHDVFIAMLPNIYEIYEAALGSQDSYAIYCVSTGLSLILLQDYPIENVPHWMEILSNLLTIEEISMNARSAIVNAINTLACKFGAEYHQFAMAIIGYVRTYCQELGLRYNDDKNGHQSLAAKVAELLMTTIKNLGEEVTEDIIEMTGELILFFGELDIVEDDLMKNILPLILYLANNHSEFITELIQNNQEILFKVTSVVSDNDFYSKECQDTANVIVQLFSKQIE